MKLVHVFHLIVLCCLAHYPNAAQALDHQTALAMYGEPKEPAGFDHFSFAKMNAPKGGTLRLGATGSFDSLNPFIIRGTVPLGVNTGTMSLIYEPLMARSWDEPFTLYALIAEYIDVADDRSSITFHLNPQAHWSDGVPITADDVLFSYQTLRDKGRPNHRSYYKKVEKAEKLDAMTVRFSFYKNAAGVVDREMPLIMGLMPVLPQHDWQDRDFNKTSLRIPVGSGPYRITAMNVGRTVTYERDTDYWGRDLPATRGLYNFDKIIVDFYRDDNIALQAFKAGQFDWRRELDIGKWTTGYDIPAVKDGTIRLERMTHQRTEPAMGFVFNTRRPLLQDAVLREAMGYAFDAGWIDKNLFYGELKRTESFFPNSELAAPLLPDDDEKKILAFFHDQLPATILTTPVRPVASDGSEAQHRANLVKAANLLRDHGYVMKDDQLYSPQKDQPIQFDVMLNDPQQDKIALAWARSLKRLGIKLRVYPVDNAQYQARLSGFDYDVIVASWVNSLSPGNEQTIYWGSAAALQKGSRNYAGVHDPVVDALVAKIPEATTRQDLVTTVHALDRVLMAGHYTVPFFYLGADDIAARARLHHPDATPLYGAVLESWWGE